MNAALPFIPKEDPECPDQYGLKIFYLTGGFDEFEAVSHKTFPETSVLEILTNADEWKMIPLNSVKKIELDSRFSKIIAYKEQKRKNESSTHPI